MDVGTREDEPRMSIPSKIECSKMPKNGTLTTEFGNGLRGGGSHLSLFMLAYLLFQVSHIHLQLGALGVLSHPLICRLLPLLFQVCQIALHMCLLFSPRFQPTNQQTSKARISGEWFQGQQVPPDEKKLMCFKGV